MNIAVLWLAAGALFMLLEALAVPGVGFLFAGLAAITTGGLVEFGIIGYESYTAQGIVFLSASFLWAAVLWVPLRKFHKKNITTEYSNMIGENAIVYEKPLLKGKIGEVKWSGTIMQAQLSDDADAQSVAPDTIVKIIAIKGNVLTVKP